MHHTGEDEVLWPLLLAAGGAVDRPGRDHAGAARAASTSTPTRSSSCWRSGSPLPPPSRGEQLARAVERFAGPLFEHLDLEEREILPLVLAPHHASEEWDSLGEHGKDVDVGAPAAADVRRASSRRPTPDERPGCWRTCRGPCGSVMMTVGAWQYRRYITRVRAG